MGRHPVLPAASYATPLLRSGLLLLLLPLPSAPLPPLLLDGLNSDFRSLVVFDIDSLGAEEGGGTTNDTSE
jgi:hypothetical protein